MKQKGYTLIEMCVVLCIMAIISGVLAFNYASKQKDIYRLKAVTGSGQIYSAFMWYYRENKNTLQDEAASQYIQKAAGVSIVDVDFNYEGQLSAKVDCNYEGERFIVEIYPVVEEYIVRNIGYEIIYNN